MTRRGRTVQNNRLSIRDDRRERTLAVPLCILGLNAIAYAATFNGLLFVDNLWGVALLIVVNGHLIGTLFTVGHDACHDSFTSSAPLNRVIARLAFLPAYMPYTAWRYTHNYLHHSFTNCGDRDFVWRPLSWAEFNGLPAWARLRERVYRSIPGLPLNWILDNWLRWHIFPRPAVRREMRKWGPITADCLLVWAWFILQVLAVMAITLWDAPFQSIEAAVATSVEKVIVCMVCPFLVWATLISYIDLLHHTHPRIRWYRTAGEAALGQRQLEGTTRIVYPCGIGLLYHNIMEHTAHHVDPKIPMYHLKEAQRDLSGDNADVVVVEAFSLRYLRTILRKCRLYDYTEHRWLDFNGTPTS